MGQENECDRNNGKKGKGEEEISIIISHQLHQTFHRKEINIKHCNNLFGQEKEYDRDNGKGKGEGGEEEISSINH